jgi:hypothetical protein
MKKERKGMSVNLIMVNVAVDNGKVDVALLNYLNGTPITKPMAVNPGDSVAWIVQVYIGNTPHALPYQVSFFSDKAKTAPDTTFFGTSKLSVAGGGTSPFVSVLSLQEAIFYSISVAGIGIVLDPEIQTGNSQVLIPAAFVPPPTYTVTWNFDNNTVWYQAGAGPMVAFMGNLQIAVGQTIAFNVTSANPVPPAQVAFVRSLGRLWASPFIQNNPNYAVPTPATAPLPVADDKDAHGTVFAFNFETTDLAKIAPTCNFSL